MASPVHAQSYPLRPVTLIVPFAPGGSTDVLARLIAGKMGEILGQEIVVQNVEGAGGTLGAAVAARGEPDGYVLLMGTPATHAIGPALYPSLPYDPVTGFAPVSLLVRVPNVLLVRPDLPVNSVAELIALLKASPGTYDYASAGNGTPGHLSAELFKTMAGVDMVHVPYKGSGPALVDLMGGYVSVMFDNLPPAIPLLPSGKLRALAVTTAERSPAVPDLPTVAESGLPGYETYSWNALFAPAGTPPAVIATLHDAAVAALADPEIRQRLESGGAISVGSTPDELAAHVQTELDKWAPVVDAAGVRIN
ncbi:MAG: Bug family tripartite tricarboxylate transporter substrate binding protein [Geminicoccaceae bacterium]